MRMILPFLFQFPRQLVNKKKTLLCELTPSDHHQHPTIFFLQNSPPFQLISIDQMEEVKTNCFVTQEIVSLLPYGQRRRRRGGEQFLLQIITVVLLIGEMCTSKKKREREREKVRLSSRR